MLELSPRQARYIFVIAQKMVAVHGAKRGELRRYVGHKYVAIILRNALRIRFGSGALMNQRAIKPSHGGCILFQLAISSVMGRKESNRIGLLEAIAYIVGNIIGTGIFVSPKGILEHVGSVGLSLILWVICAFINMVSAVNFIELGSSIPESGAELSYVTYIGWHPIGFAILWLSAVIQSSCSGAILFVTFGNYIMQALEPVVCLTHSTQQLAVKFFGFGLMFLLTVSNMYSLRKVASKIQTVSMFSKVFTLVSIVGVGFYFLIFKGYTSHFKPDYAFSGSDWSPTAIVLAIYQGNWAYSGYTTMNFGTEEVEQSNFSKTLTRAVFGGLGLVTVIYILTNIAYFTVLTPEEILKSEAVATLFIQKTLGQGAAYAMPGLIGLLLIGTMNSDVFAWSRFMLAGARKGMMPTAFALVHPENDSPRVAVLAHTTFCVFFSFMGNVETLIKYISIVGMIRTCFTVTALIVIKLKKIPVAKNAVKFNIFWPFLNLALQLVLISIPFVQDWEPNVIGMGLFVIASAAYYILVYPKRKPKFVYILDDAVTKFFQKLLWTVVDTGPEYQIEIEEKKPIKDSEDWIERF